MKVFLTSSILFLVLSICGQETPNSSTKGLKPIATKVEGSGQTYAVVVGISDYQDEGIPDLRFADKDAEAFAGFLQSPAGGSLDEDHLKVLLNSDATTAQFDASLSWLIDESKEGDQTIIYFSGHGDVEMKTRRQQGFLLCWDSPSKAYVAGAYPIFFIQEVIATLSLENKAKVLVITDACRSGKLAGSSIGGSQLTSQNLAQQYANETKILSCQPNEYSIEGEQWGGGRGAFSYHLIDGLIGMADNNEDQIVNLMEISRYLEDKVTMEVAPQSQVPMTVGNRTRKLTDVFPDLLAQAQDDKLGGLELFAATEMRGMEEDVLASVDSTIRNSYLLFKTYLKEKIFLDPVDACVDTYYTKLVDEPSIKRLHAAMRRNYAAALQDESQQALNNILNGDPSEMGLSKASQTKKYSPYPNYLQRAAELLGDRHYMYSIIQARKLYFEGYLLHTENRSADRELGKKAIAKYREALDLQPDFPHPYYSMAAAYFWQMEQLDSAAYYTGLAVEKAPSWFVPYTSMAKMYTSTGNIEYLDEAKHFMDLADQVDSTASVTNVWQMFQWFRYFNMNRNYSKAEHILKSIIEIDDNFAVVYQGMGLVYTNTYRYNEAIIYLRKAIEMDSTDHLSMTLLGSAYYYQEDLEKAEEAFLASLQLEESEAGTLAGLGMVYLSAGRDEKADKMFKKAVEFAGPKTCLPCLYSKFSIAYGDVGNYDKGEKLLLEGLQFDTNNLMLLIVLGSLYQTQGLYYKAEEVLLKSYQLDPNNSYVTNALGWNYYKLNQFEKAEEQMLNTLSIDSLDSEGLVCLAILKGRQELYIEAEALALKAVKVSPMNPHGANTLGFIYAKSGRFVEADLHLKKALELVPNDNNNAPSVFLHYAMLHSMQNNLDEAFDYLEMVGKMDHFSAYFYTDLKTESALAPLRADTERWDTLMEQYFTTNKNNK